MARILLAGPQRSIAQRSFLASLQRRLDEDGHVVASPDDAGSGGPRALVQDVDAVLAVLDGETDAATVTLVALAHADNKPVLGLHGAGEPLPALLAACVTTPVAADDGQAVLAALDAFYDTIKPFSGRLVRDQIPRLVRESGHNVAFREVPREQRAAYLKRKVAEEARELEAAGLGDEKEEVADVLEALEAFIRARDYDRDALRQVKQAKLKRRGGFERCYVVEEARPEAAAANQDAPSPVEELEEVEMPIALPSFDEAPEPEFEPEPPVARQEEAPLAPGEISWDADDVRPVAASAGADDDIQLDTIDVEPRRGYASRRRGTDIREL
ncbi:MAG: hypothetical protein ACPGQL_00920 [Thermoplasmatota archaeon]